ncbi:helix-turn-helix domain-containing protein [Blautia producta]|uniref:helix-turn-helix domain-containing protein n=1 Tax=Blautia producta TaxID=33035 RepID=UPI000497290A
MQELDFEIIGKRLREVRLSKGFTQEYVANKVDVNTSHISNIENNRVKVSLSALVNICNALETTVDYVLNNQYADSDSVLNQNILNELQNCDEDMKERILKIIQILE